VSNGLETVGVMLPYMPFHYLLFTELATPVIVLTSGNLAEEPIAIENSEATRRLSGVADAYLLHNRDIHNRNDDSVLFAAAESPAFIRRSRGYAPEPIAIGLDAEGIAACGAELKGSFCIGKGAAGILSQHLGDLKNPETYDFYREAFHRFCELFRFSPRLAVCDKHPDYLSTRFAEELTEELGIPVRRVQHHYAHVAACMAENSVREKVIGVSMDGTGYGDDGAIWGGEFFLCDLDGYQRFTHFEYLPLPGGDAAIKEPWRMAVAVLRMLYGERITTVDHPVLKLCTEEDLGLLLAAIDKRINTPVTSSTGRLFDAAAALTGITTHAGFEAEAPMRLESAIEADDGAYPFESGETIVMRPAFEALLADLGGGVSPGRISARFHNTVAAVVVDTAAKMASETGVTKVALTGGVFQNRYLLERCTARMAESGMSVLTHTKVPANDGGIALGQLAVAAAAS
jgi:hydrogenase maturation protein HypF